MNKKKIYPKIDYSMCTGCGSCFSVCLYYVYSFNGEKPEVNYPKQCTGCRICIKDCPERAISLVED